MIRLLRGLSLTKGNGWAIILAGATGLALLALQQGKQHHLVSSPLPASLQQSLAPMPPPDETVILVCKESSGAALACEAVTQSTK